MVYNATYMPTEKDFINFITQLEAKVAKGSLSPDVAGESIGDLSSSVTTSFQKGEISFQETLEIRQKLSSLRKKIENAFLGQGIYEPIGSADEIVVRKYFSKTTLELLKGAFSPSPTEGGEVGRQVWDEAIEFSLEKIKQKFVGHGLSLSPPLTEAESERLWQEFRALVLSAKELILYQLFYHESINIDELTAKQNKLLRAAETQGALAASHGFNQLELVKSTDTDPEKFSPNMGLVQKMVYAMFQELKKDYDPNSRDGQSRTSAFSRNTDFTDGKTVPELIEVVSGLNEITLRDGNVVSLGIQSELNKFPPEARKVIKQIAIWKASRDDIGSDAGMFHLGYNKGAPKYQDGDNGSNAAPRLLANALYRVGKHRQDSFDAGIFFLIDPVNSEFMAKGRPAGTNERYNPRAWSNTQNRNIVIKFLDLGNYLTYLYPQLEKNKVEIPRFKQKHWFELFPTLDRLFNQEIGKEKNASEYIQARDNMTKMLELVVKSPFLTKKIFEEEKESLQRAKRIQDSLFKPLATNISLINSFIGMPGEKREFDYVHELIIASFKFVILNALCAIPAPKNYMDSKHDETLRIIVANLKEYWESNSSLKPYVDDIERWLNTNLKLFRKHYDLTNENAVNQNRQAYLLKLDPGRYLGNPRGLLARIRAKNSFLTSPPTEPIDFSGGWVPVKKGDD